VVLDFVHNSVRRHVFCQGIKTSFRQKSTLDPRRIQLSDWKVTGIVSWALACSVLGALLVDVLTSPPVVNTVSVMLAVSSLKREFRCGIPLGLTGCYFLDKPSFYPWVFPPIGGSIRCSLMLCSPWRMFEEKRDSPMSRLIMRDRYAPRGLRMLVLIKCISALYFVTHVPHPPASVEPMKEHGLGSSSQPLRLVAGAKFISVAALP
jgi:hypothetical protein